MAAEDLTGLELARAFYLEAVAPILDSVRPGLRHTAGLFGDCSDVIGLDDEISRNHGWGPRCQLLLEPDGFDATRAALSAALAARLPLRFRGWPTSFEGYLLVERDAPPVAHWVDMWTPEGFLRESLGVPRATRLGPRDWLAMAPDKLLGVTAGELFRDDLGFAETRRALAFYPDDVRLCLMVVEWTRILDEQAFPARAGSRGDELGSAIIAARLAERLMRLCFHLERRYMPYAKWFGSGFRRLAASERLGEPLARMVAAPGWRERDRCFAEALAEVLSLHERAGLLAPGKYRPDQVYLGRHGTGLPAFERGGQASIASLINDIRARIADPETRACAEAVQPA